MISQLLYAAPAAAGDMPFASRVEGGEVTFRGTSLLPSDSFVHEEPHSVGNYHDCGSGTILYSLYVFRDSEMPLSL